jgi:hypothetical protein
MDPEIIEKDRERLRRVSKARIFDGHPLKLSVHAIFMMVSTCIVIIAVISALFSYSHQTEYFLILWTLLPSALLGFVLLIWERLLGHLKNHMFFQMGKLLTAFLLFFIHAIGYLALSSIVVSYPVGYFMEGTMGMAGMAGDYSLFFANFFIVLALLSWLRNARAKPNSCF